MLCTLSSVKHRVLTVCQVRLEIYLSRYKTLGLTLNTAAAHGSVHVWQTVRVSEGVFPHLSECCCQCAVELVGIRGAGVVICADKRVQVSCWKKK